MITLPPSSRLLLAGGCLATMLISVSARAQVLEDVIPSVNQSITGIGVEPEVTVVNRSRPDYQPLGVRVGSFIIRPDAFSGIGYDSNPGASTSAQGSVVVRSGARIQANSNWSRNSLFATLAVDDTRYLSQSRFSFTNWSAAVGGTVDIGRDTLTVRYTHRTLSQSARDIDVPQLGEALAYRIDSAHVDERIVFSRVSLIPAVDVDYYDYDDGTIGNAPYLQKFRNRVVVTPSLQAEYELAPRRNIVAVIRDGVASYTGPLDGQARRNFNDVAVLGGLDFDATSNVRFRALAGYEVRTFNSQAYKTIQSPVVEATAIWTPTGLTTVTGSAQRRIQDSSDDNTAGVTTTALSLQVDHEYLRNILLQGKAGVALAEYGRGGGEQFLYTAGANVSYLMNRNVTLTGSYSFARRQSGSSGSAGASGAGFSNPYSDNLYLLQLKFGL